MWPFTRRRPAFDHQRAQALLAKLGPARPPNLVTDSLGHGPAPLILVHAPPAEVLGAFTALGMDISREMQGDRFCRYHGIGRDYAFGMIRFVPGGQGPEEICLEMVKDAATTPAEELAALHALHGELRDVLTMAMELREGRA